jgi:type II secretory pathway pseudopilin PulG
MKKAALSRRWRHAFTTLEMVVVAAIVVLVAAFAFPTVSFYKKRAHRAVALEKMRLLGGAVSSYAQQNGGLLPAEDAPGNDSWQGIAAPDATAAWYNALPQLIGRKTAAAYHAAPSDFYADDNVLYLPGANYPDQKKFMYPMFAIAFNTKLQRKDAHGKKERTRMEHVTNPAKTVVLLEQGLTNEVRTLGVQTKKDYDGSPKGSAKSFVGRYDGQGVLFFLDGHAQLVPVKDTLTETGRFPFPQTDIVWTRTPEENPNREDAAAALSGGSGDAR